MVSRTERSVVGEWWWTVDKLMLTALATLMLIGIVLSLAASPPVGARLGLDPFHFVNRHVLFLVPALGVLIGTSLLTPQAIRRVSLLVFVVSLVLIGATLVYGAEIKGARRWLVLFGVNVQPSEFLKPAFTVLIAWLFGETARRPEMPANTLALVWGALFFMAGMRMVWVVGLAGAAATGLGIAYLTTSHVARRIDRFVDPAAGDNFNITVALESFSRGGWFGQGPGEGTIKRILPEAHTDFVFAVAAEEFGIVLCLILVALAGFIVIRALVKAMQEEDPFARFAVTGLGILFGVQAAINMAVNLHLLPAKGMTFPFVSYGGSSMLSTAFAMGVLLALTRERPRAEALELRDTGLAGQPA